MADVTIRNGHPSEVMQDDRRAYTERLAEDLRASGLTVDLQIVEYVPGRRGLTYVEWTFITLGALGAFTEVYEMTRRSLISRRESRKSERGSAGRHLGVTISGPDGEHLKSWDTRDEG